jgi:ankyrin repeat protein
VVKIIDINRFDEEYKESIVYDTLQEAMMQIIIYEATKSIKIRDIGLDGPFAPKFFLIGRELNKIYIVMERLQLSLDNYLDDRNKSSTWRAPDSSFIKGSTVQICMILKILFEKLKYNHRDFKPDNIMLNLIGDRPTIKLIDFGFSCLKYNNMTLKSVSPGLFPSDLKHCDSPIRDMHAYFFYLTKYTYYRHVDCPIKRVIRTLMASDQKPVKNWSNTYYEYNEKNAANSKEKSENLSVDVVYNVFKSLKFTSLDTCSRVNSTWTGNLVRLYDSTPAYLTKSEFLNISPDLTGPFIALYLHNNYDIFWMRNNDPYQLTRYFQYKLPVLMGEYSEYIKASPLELENIRALFIESDNLFKTDLLGESIFHKLGRSDDTAEIREFLDKAIDKIKEVKSKNRDKRVDIINKVNDEGKTALDIALEKNFKYAEEKLIEAGANLDPQVMIRIPSILGYVVKRNPEIMLRSVNMKGETILHILAFKNNEESNKLIDTILEINTSPEFLNKTTAFGTTALNYAIQKNNAYACQRLMDLNVNVNDTTFFFDLEKISDPVLMNKLFDKYVKMDKINTVDYDGDTPLINAVKSNNIIYVKKLLSTGKVLTAKRDNYGRTCLHYAVINSQNLPVEQRATAFELVKLLIAENPALPNIKNYRQKGPGNPNFAINETVRDYVKTRKSTFFKKHQNTNKSKKSGGRKTHRSRRK